MAAYLIVHRRDINDSKALKAYADGVQKTIEDHAGEVIVRADRFEVLEGNWSPGEKQVDDHPGLAASLGGKNR